LGQLREPPAGEEHQALAVHRLDAGHRPLVPSAVTQLKYPSRVTATEAGPCGVISTRSTDAVTLPGPGGGLRRPGPRPAPLHPALQVALLAPGHAERSG